MLLEGYDGDVEELAKLNRTTPDEYVQGAGEPYAGWLRVELRFMERVVGMTSRQRLIFDLYWVYGLSLDQIGVRLGISGVGVYNLYKKARAKASAYSTPGLLTATVETFGWDGARSIITKLFSEAGVRVQR